MDIHLRLGVYTIEQVNGAVAVQGPDAFIARQIDKLYQHGRRTREMQYVRQLEREDIEHTLWQAWWIPDVPPDGREASERKLAEAAAYGIAPWRGALQQQVILVVDQAEEIARWLQACFREETGQTPGEAGYDLRIFKRTAGHVMRRMPVARARMLLAASLAGAHDDFDAGPIISETRQALRDGLKLAAPN